MEGKHYPSDITREQFEEIRSLLESSRKKTKPRQVDLFDIFNGILYLLKTGCQWEMLPSEFPNYKLCHYYFSQWKEEKEGKESILNRCLKKISWRGEKKQWTEREHKFSYS